MIIEISARNLTISPASRKQIAAYNLLLAKYFKRIHSIRWVFEIIGKGVGTRLQIHAFSGDYRASASGKTIREALVTACDSVERQRRRRKRILERSRRATGKVTSKSGKTFHPKNKTLSPEDFGV